jgi:hypothetical protein
LLVGIAVVALGCVALTNASSLWVSLTFAAVLLVLDAAILFVFLRQGSDRAFWIRFTVYGWQYVLLLVFGWTFEPHTYSPLAPDRLLTTQLSQDAYDRLYGDDLAKYEAANQPMLGGSTPYGMSDSVASMMVPSATTGVPAPPPAFTGPKVQQFTSVAHGLWAIVLPVGGGWLAKWVYARRRELT